MWRVKLIVEDVHTGLEAYEYYDFSEDMQAWRFRELAMKASNVKAIYLPFKIIK